MDNTIVRLEIPPFLQKFTEGITSISLSCSTVGECLQNFVSRFPEARNLLFDKNGKLFNDIDIFINRVSTYPERLKRRVKNGDELYILRFICGG